MASVLHPGASGEREKNAKIWVIGRETAFWSKFIGALEENVIGLLVGAVLVQRNTYYEFLTFKG